MILSDEKSMKLKLKTCCAFQLLMFKAQSDNEATRNRAVIMFALILFTKLNYNDNANQLDEGLTF